MHALLPTPACCLSEQHSRRPKDLACVSAVDERPDAAGAGNKGQAASQGAVGWAVNTASNTVGFGRSLTEAAFRGVGRTTGSAVNTAGSIASRASEAP